MELFHVAYGRFSDQFDSSSSSNGNSIRSTEGNYIQDCLQNSFDTKDAGSGKHVNSKNTLVLVCKAKSNRCDITSIMTEARKYARYAGCFSEVLIRLEWPDAMIKKFGSRSRLFAPEKLVEDRIQHGRHTEFDYHLRKVNLKGGEITTHAKQQSPLESSVVPIVLYVSSDHYSPDWIDREIRYLLKNRCDNLQKITIINSFSDCNDGEQVVHLSQGDALRIIDDMDETECLTKNYLVPCILEISRIPKPDPRNIIQATYQSCSYFLIGLMMFLTVFDRIRASFMPMLSYIPLVGYYLTRYSGGRILNGYPGVVQCRRMMDQRVSNTWFLRYYGEGSYTILQHGYSYWSFGPSGDGIQDGQLPRYWKGFRHMLSSSQSGVGVHSLLLIFVALVIGSNIFASIGDVWDATTSAVLNSPWYNNYFTLFAHINFSAWRFCIFTIMAYIFFRNAFRLELSKKYRQRVHKSRQLCMALALQRAENEEKGLDVDGKRGGIMKTGGVGGYADKARKKCWQYYQSWCGPIVIFLYAISINTMVYLFPLCYIFGKLLQWLYSMIGGGGGSSGDDDESSKSKTKDGRKKRKQVTFKEQPLPLDVKRANEADKVEEIAEKEGKEDDTM